MHDLETIQRINAEAVSKSYGRSVATVGAREIEKIVNWFVAEICGEESNWVTIDSISTSNAGELLQLKANIEPIDPQEPTYEVTLDIADSR